LCYSYAQEASPVSITRVFKPVIILTLSAVLFSTAGSGQTRKSDLSLQFGVFSSDHVIDIFGDTGLIVIPLGSYDKRDMTFSGVPFLTYHYSANDRFGFGGAIGYYSASGALVASGDDVVVGDFREKCTIGAVELDYHWVMKPGFQLLLGRRLRRQGPPRELRGRDGHGDQGAAGVPSQPHGLRLGKKVGFFAELGIAQGILAVGPSTGSSEVKTITALGMAALIAAAAAAALGAIQETAQASETIQPVSRDRWLAAQAKAEENDEAGNFVAALQYYLEYTRQAEGLGIPVHVAWGKNNAAYMIIKMHRTDPPWTWLRPRGARGRPGRSRGDGGLPAVMSRNQSTPGDSSGRPERPAGP
jgi:hypothetical protein